MVVYAEGVSVTVESLNAAGLVGAVEKYIEDFGVVKAAFF